MPAKRPQRRTGQDKECPVCHTRFYVEPSHMARRRFCSRACEAQARQAQADPMPPIPCAYCQQFFVPRKPDAHYCSHACASAGRRVPRQAVTCATCGTVFTVNRARVGQARFCSRACRYASQRAPLVRCTCVVCGTLVYRKPGRVRPAGKVYCSHACRYADPATQERLRTLNLQLQQHRPTRLEVRGYELLDNLRLVYYRQYRVRGKFCVDAYVPAWHLVIQFDGDYWHGHPDRFSVLTARQYKQQQRDVAQDRYLLACGYRVLRIWESELISDPGHVAARIQAFLDLLDSETEAL